MIIELNEKIIQPKMEEKEKFIFSCDFSDIPEREVDIVPYWDEHGVRRELRIARPLSTNFEIRP